MKIGKRILLSVLMFAFVFALSACGTQKYVVSFNTDNGSYVNSQEVKDGETATKPADPTKEGFRFEGWYIGENLYDFSTKVTADVRLTAKWTELEGFSVKFDSDGGSDVADQTVYTDGKVSKPSDPTKEGYTFEGWYNGSKAYDFDTVVTKDLTLKAKWTKGTTSTDDDVNATKYTVTFDSNGGSKVSSKTVTENKTVAKPTNPTRSGYVFVEWQLDGKAYNFSTKVTKNITLKAVWKVAAKYTVTFNSNGGSAVASQTVNEGAKATKPANPTRSGYTFDGWRTGSATGAAYDFNKVLTGSITLFAAWKSSDSQSQDQTNVENAIKNLAKVNIEKAGTSSLPTTNSGATITWKDAATKLATITRGTSDTNVTLSITVKSGSVSKDTTVTGVILKSPYKYTTTVKTQGFVVVMVNNGATGYSLKSSVAAGNYVAAAGGVQLPEGKHTAGTQYTLTFNNDANTKYIVVAG